MATRKHRPDDKTNLEQDAAKITLTLSARLLKWIDLYPGPHFINTTVTSCLTFTMLLVFLAGQVAFVKEHLQDLNVVIVSLSSISITIQTMAKILTLYFGEKRLKLILDTIFTDFWPCNINDPAIEAKIRFESKIFNGYYVAVISMGCTYATFVPIVSLFSKPRILPYPSVYPFDWTATPIFQLIVFFHFVCYFYIGVCIILGHDTLFTAIMRNLVSQFETLQQVMTSLGSTKAKEFNKVLDQLAEDRAGTYSGVDEDEKLLRRCAVHHNILKKLCQEAQTIFGFSAFVQLFCSTISLCVVCFISAAGGLTAITPNLMMYVFGHSMQLFIICIFGNEITYQTSVLPKYIFGSNWYNIRSTKTKKEMLFVMLQSTKEFKFSALGLAFVDYNVFINVVKLSFSAYTMLANFATDGQINF